MTVSNNLALNKIIEDMSEGVMTLGMNGTILYLNASAEKILNMNMESLVNQKFVNIFIKYKENDEFNQAILDAIYHYREHVHTNVAPYYDGKKTKQVRIISSFLCDSEKQIGIVVVLSDITEVTELRTRHARQIRILLDSLVKALSTAIDERSHYNAKHTQNMVAMGGAFLDWLQETDSEWRFDAEKRHIFLMAVWLHDIGKLAVPLGIMDKADRLGSLLNDIEQRFIKIKLLNKIAFLEGRTSDYISRNAQLDDILNVIRSINPAGFLSDENYEKVLSFAKMVYEDENGTEQPVLTAEETDALSIRRGTLTDSERKIMQSHAEVTERILSQVTFPENYRCVPLWASSHHELLDGTGYPRRLSGDEIPKEVRLLTILDIFEALTSKDRPYKQPMSVEKAFEILYSMVSQGRIDGTILALFEKSRAWENMKLQNEE